MPGKNSSFYSRPFGMRKIIIDKDDAIIYISFICSVLSVPQM